MFYKFVGKINKKIVIVFLFAAIVSLFPAFGAVAEEEEGGDPFEYDLMVPIPQPGDRAPVATVTGAEGKGEGYAEGISGYINVLYLFGLGIAGVLAFGALVYGGFLWTVSGAMDKKTQAKSIIGNALLGIAILATSYIMLHTINPDLVGPQFDPSAGQEIGVGGDRIPLDPYKNQDAACTNAVSDQDCSFYSDQVKKIAGYAANGDEEMIKLAISWIKACDENKCDICSDDREVSKPPAEGQVCTWDPNFTMGPTGVFGGVCVTDSTTEGCTSEDESASEADAGDNGNGQKEKCENDEDCWEIMGEAEPCWEWRCMDDGTCDDVHVDYSTDPHNDCGTCEVCRAIEGNYDYWGCHPKVCENGCCDLATEKCLAATDGAGYCEECIEGHDHEVTECEDYETELKSEYSWRKICKEDPCGVSSSGCKVGFWGGACKEK